MAQVRTALDAGVSAHPLDPLTPYELKLAVEIMDRAEKMIKKKRAPAAGKARGKVDA